MNIVVWVYCILWNVKKSMLVIISRINCFLSEGINYKIGRLIVMFINVLIILSVR